MREEEERFHAGQMMPWFFDSLREIERPESLEPSWPQYSWGLDIWAINLVRAGWNIFSNTMRFLLGISRG